MTALAWSAPLVLAVVLALAGGAKLAVPDRTRASFTSLGLPAPGALAVAVPTLELVTAALLVAAPRVGAALALVLLGGFSVFLARRVAQGSTEPCACFGRVRSRPVGPVDLARNGVLIGLALLTLAWPPA